MKSVIKIALALFAALLVLLLVDRLLLNPRPLSSVGKVALFLIVGGAALWAVSLIALRTRLASMVTDAWLIVISSLIAYLAVDFAGGALFIRPLSPALQPDGHVHHRLVPDKASYLETAEYAYLQRVNRMGLRGAEVAAPKPAGTFRILMLGDSFTMGKGVQDSQTFSSLLQESLNRPAPGVHGPFVEVVNGGVDSYSPVLSRLQLQEMAPALSPDLVVLNLDMSDLIQEQAYRSVAVKDAAGTIIAVPAPPETISESWDSWLGRVIDRNLFITRLLIQKVREWDSDPERLTVHDVVNVSNFELLKHTLARDKVDRQRQWADIFDSVLGIRHYCDKRRIGFLLTVYPWGHQVSSREWPEGRVNFLPPDAPISDESVQRLQAFAASSGTHIVNLFPALRARPRGEPLYFRFDMHWTPAGHRVVAAELDHHIRPLVPWER